MVHHCCSKQKVRRGLWSPEEDEKLIKHITAKGHDCWSSVPKLAGMTCILFIFVEILLILFCLLMWGLIDLQDCRGVERVAD